MNLELINMNLELIAAAFLCACMGGLVMYISAQENATPVYETRRSIVLLEAARDEAAKRRFRERAKGPRDKTVIYLGREWELLWWSDQLGVSVQTLTAAVQAVGPMATDIRHYFHAGTLSRPRRAREDYRASRDARYQAPRPSRLADSAI